MEVEIDGVCLQEVESEVIDILSELRKHLQDNRHKQHHCYRSRSAQGKVYNEHLIVTYFPCEDQIPSTHQLSIAIMVSSTNV